MTFLLTTIAVVSLIVVFTYVIVELIAYFLDSADDF